MRITTRLALLFLGISLVPVLLLTTYGYRSGKERQREDLGNHLESLARHLEEQIAHEIRQNRAMLHLMLSREALWEQVDAYVNRGAGEAVRDRISGILGNTCERIPSFLNVAVLDTGGGLVLGAAPPDEDMRAVLPLAYARGREREDDRLWSRRDNALRLYLTGPIRHGGRLVGVLVIQTAGSEIEKRVAAQGGKDGTLAASLSEEAPDGSLRLIVPARRVHPRTADILSQTWRMEDPDWTLALAVNHDQALASFRGFREGAALALGLALLASLLCSLLVSRHLARPLLRLIDLARDFSAGDLSRRSAMVARDELGDLGRSLDAMAANLERAKQELEATVAARTLALQREVDGHKATEARLRAARNELQDYVDHLSTMSAKLTVAGRVVSANRAALAALGRSAGEVRRTDFLSGPWPRQEPGGEAKVRRAFLEAAGGRPADLETRVHLGTRTVDIHLSLNPVLDAAGRVEYIIAEARDISALKAAQSALCEVNESLEESVRERTESLRAALREKDMLLREVHHRVKNNLQIISSLLSLQSIHVRDPDVSAVLSESRNRVKSMALLHERLYAGDDLGKVGFSGYLRDLAAQLLRSSGADNRGVVLDLDLQDVEVGLSQAIPCGLTVHELLANSLKHAFPPDSRPHGPHPKVSIQCRPLPQGGFELEVGDNGVGLPEGIESVRGRTLGLHLVHTLVKQLRGRLDVERSGGSRFRISIPAVKAAAGELERIHAH